MNDTTTGASGLAEIGLRVFPCRPNDKRPQVTDWPNVATTDEETLLGWFGVSRANLAIRCGRTDTEVSIFVVDIDIKDDAPGKESWAQFCRQHPEVREEAQLTASVSTPSGGWHFYFAVPEGYDLPANGKPWPGVDIRGEGGYVLAPPSKLPNGEYTWVRTIEEDGIMYAPPALMEAVLTPRSEVPQVPRSVLDVSTLVQPPTPQRLDVGDSPITHMKGAFRVYDFLLRQGWQAGRRRGDQEEMTRPGKSAREGTSATMHHDENIVNIHTSTIPAEFAHVGHPTRNGGYTLNGFDCFMLENGFSDEREAMSAARRMMLPRESVAPSSAVPETTDSTVQVEVAVGPTSTLNLPDEFWESRDWLTAVRDAAHNRLISADAVLGAVITRFATVIPPRYKIPAIVGAHSTFDQISILVGASGAGKSAAMAVARELYPGPGARKDIVWDIPVPSGEGLVDKFFEFVEEKDSAGKTKRENRKTKTAVHFSIDEAMALVSAGKGRQGATIGSVLCTAWSGGDPGQSNASKERDRQGLKPFTFRMAGLAGVQMALGHHLLDDEWVRQGLSGRLVFFAAEDPTIPDPDADTIPDFPAPLELETPPTVDLELTYDDEIVAEVRRDHYMRQSGKVQEAPIDGHQRLIRLKLSGIMALMDGRNHVAISDWELAAEILASSTRIRNAMLSAKQLQDRDASHTRAVATAETEMIKEDHKERKAIALLADKIGVSIPKDGGIGINALRKKVCSAKTKHRFQAALDQAIQRGTVAVDNSHVTRA